MESAAKVWLGLQCQTIPGVAGGVMLFPREPGAEGKPIATWPPAAPVLTDLLAVARSAAAQDQVVLAGAPDGKPGFCIAVPIADATGPVGAVALDLPAATQLEAGVVVGRLQSGAIWLVALAAESLASERLRWVLELVSASLAQVGMREAAMAVATELATHLRCERVGVGFLRHGRIRVEAISHSTHFDGRSDLVRQLGAAMEEAVDQQAVLCYPPRADAQPRVLRAHEQLAQVHGTGEISSLPIASRGEIVGVITLERPPGVAFSDAEQSLCLDAVALLGPGLALRREAELRLWERGRDAFAAELGRLGGPGHLAHKLALAGGILFLAILLLLPVEYRVTADATLEGRVQRAIVAGVDGFIAEANVRAGDLVRKGQTVGRLDDRDLRVEQQKWTSRLEELRVDYFEALASHDRTQINISQTKTAQARAQLALLEAQLGRTRLLAPFDGVVVQGDLSQSLGSPVSRGDVLFQVAPLDGYRIILKVDERDVAELRERRRGRLTLSAMPGHSLAFTLERLTPVAVAEEGRNYFRAEARLDQPSRSLRPGMRGVAKIEIDRRALGWVLTHDLFDWVRMQLWSWWP